jgi:cardiolipin synthase
MGRRRRLLVVAVALVATGCTSGAVGSGAAPGQLGSGTSAAAPATSPGSLTRAPSGALPAAPSGALSLLTEPDQGLAPVYALITTARRSIDLTMYELVDVQAEIALVTAAHRGVDVRIVLDTNRERQANQPAYDLLRAAGAHVVWADSRYEATHEKAMVVDDQLAVVMTLNLTSRYYATTRDFAVLDRDPADVAAIETVFVADYDHAKTTGAALPPGHDLVWSPGPSQQALLALINAAHRTLAVENEELASKPVLAALVAAAHRRVSVTLVMTDQSDWHAGFSTLTQAGAKVEVYAADASLYIHAKVVIADAGQPGGRAFVGSENFSAASLDRNRELGLITADPTVVHALAATLNSDAAGGSVWVAKK